MSNLLATDIQCMGQTLTIVTARNMGPPPESLDSLADRHDAQVADAEASCSGGGALPTWEYHTAWPSDSLQRHYCSTAGHGEARHDADVAWLQSGPYPPD